MNAPMKHEDAIRTQAVERYLLRQMTEDELAIFEKHFFECDDCAAEVADGTQMMIAGRFAAANVVPMPKPKPKPKLLRWPAAVAASLAFTLLGGLAGYLVAKWLLHEPTELVAVVRINTRVPRGGAPAPIPVVRPGDELRFDVQPSDDAVKYAVVVTCGEKTESTHGISREMAADAVSLRLGELPAGRCELVVQGVRKDGKRFLITSNPFTVGER